MPSCGHGLGFGFHKKNLSQIMPKNAPQLELPYGLTQDLGHFWRMANLLGVQLLRRQINRERVFRVRSAPIDWPETYLKERLHVRKEVFIHLCEILENDLQRPTKRSHGLPTAVCVAAALKFYASGSFYIGTGDLLQLPKSSVCRAVWQVSSALTDMVNLFVQFPAGRALVDTRRHLYTIAGKMLQSSDAKCITPHQGKSVAQRV